MNTYARKPTPKVRKHFELTPAESQAMADLALAGYAFPTSSDVGVVRRMLRDAWEKQFPGKPFPSEEEK